ncbi:MAG: UDP-N-acetylglucosamine 1-carboxyvinyltransferase [bacterium]|nr:UDP-N-acetylglucosamine 1-carboxyvinyltransferase [bacterium]
MDKYIINGGNYLNGSIKISGAKNAAVAILPAVLLCDETCRIENIPCISDVNLIINILKSIGSSIKVINKNTLEINCKNVGSYTLSSAQTSGMRASSYFIGALLGRFNRARVAPPGGCDFGVRPIDQHIKGFEALGARVIYDNAMVDAKATELVGSSIYLDKVSVGATINIMLAAVKAKGLTIIENAAKEPHVVDLATFLNSMGADIMGAGTNVIKIRGVDYLHSSTYSIIPDQIEAGTYMAAVAAAGGNVVIENVIPKHLESIISKLTEAGVTIEEYEESVRVVSDKKLVATNLLTMPHPGFPTDMQPQMTTLLALADGVSIVNEGVWDNRFRYINQLILMGADITVDGKTAIVKGVKHFNSAPVCATDLRAGAALVIAALATEGVSEISNIHYIERGYEDIIEKLKNVGADIKRIYVPDPNKVDIAL